MFVGRAISSYRPATMPILSRGQYPRELQAWTLLPIMLGLVEGSVTSVLVKLGFDDLVATGAVSSGSLDAAVAILAASPAFANVLNFVWATLSHGRHKVRFAVNLMSLTAALVAIVSIAPRSAFGLWLTVVAIVLSRVCWSGVITMRSTIWRANYPPNTRARMAGNFSAVQAITMASTAVLLGQMLERWDEAYRIAYPLGALFGLAGAWSFMRLRVRGHRSLLQSERDHRAETRGGALFDPAAFIRILVHDARFRWYMSAMFVFGFGNLMVLPALVLVLTEQFALTEAPSMLITAAIPLGLMPVFIPFWSHYLDRTNILEFRSVHCWCFVSMIVVILVATLTNQVWLLFVAAVLKALAMAGGVLGWNLGHHDFAPRHIAAQYMGVHVTLTGLRGMIAPLLAVPLYRFFEHRVHGSGGLIFAVCLVFSLTGALWFQLLRMRYAGDMTRDNA